MGGCSARRLTHSFPLRRDMNAIESALSLPDASSALSSSEGFPAMGSPQITVARPSNGGPMVITTAPYGMAGRSRHSAAAAQRHGWHDAKGHGGGY